MVRKILTVLRGRNKVEFTVELRKDEKENKAPIKHAIPASEFGAHINKVGDPCQCYFTFCLPKNVLSQTYNGLRRSGEYLTDLLK